MKFSTPEQTASYRRLLDNERYFLYNIDEYITAPMFGFKDNIDK